MISIPQNKLITAVDKLSSIGLVITPDNLQNAIHGKLYRVGTTDKPRGRDGWYKLLHDATLDFITLLYGNWITQESHKHYINLKDDGNYRKLSPQEHQEQQRQFNARIEAQKAQELKEIERKRSYYVGIYKSLSGVDSHGYLTRKGINYIPSYDLRLDTRNNNNLLCVPFFNANNEMQGYQTIAVDGTKLFNGSVGGNFWCYPKNNLYFKMFNSTNSFFILCEGLATGLSAYQAITEHFDSGIILPIVLCAFNVGNISKVINATKQHKLPYLYLIDNDSTKIRNAGIETAKSVLDTHQDCEIYPLTFNHGQDANDFILENGNFAFIQELYQYSKPLINNDIKVKGEIMNNYTSKQIVNQLIKNKEIDKTQPIEIAPMSESNSAVDISVPTAPSKSPVVFKIHKSDYSGITDMDELNRVITSHVKKVDFLQYVDDMGGNRNKYIRDDKIKIPHGILAVIACDNAIKIIEQIGYALCQLSEGDNDIKSAYLFNGKYWLNITDRWIKNLLRDVLISMGYDPLEAKMFGLGMALIQTFWDYVPRTPSKDKNKILINLRNGTLHVSPNGEIKQLAFNKNDFLLYCLDYEYSPDYQCPLFTKYLNRVLPDKESQNVLQELIGSIFIKNINLEKIGILLGSGANGKSVLLKIITAMLGDLNISQMDLKALTTDRNADNNRSHLLGKLLNFAPEINARGEQAHDIIKRMASGEAIQAKLMYKDTFIMTDYAKLIFNANSLPTDVEHSHGFFRRFLIVNFDQTISEAEKDPELANKIIANELPAVLNWVIEGTKRLQQNKQFSYCEKSDEILSEYQIDSDVVALWVEDRCYVPHDFITQTLKELYNDFVDYASQSGYRKLPIDRTLAKSLKSKGFKERKGKPSAFYLTKDKTKNNTTE